MVVHPAPGSWNGTFVNALVYHLEKGAGGMRRAADFGSSLNGPGGEHNPGMRPGIVHRLDKGTTGVLLAAKNAPMQAKLASLFAKRQVSLRLSFCLAPSSDENLAIRSLTLLAIRRARSSARVGLEEIALAWSRAKCE